METLCLSVIFLFNVLCNKTRICHENGEVLLLTFSLNPSSSSQQAYCKSFTHKPIPHSITSGSETCANEKSSIPVVSLPLQ